VKQLLIPYRANQYRPHLIRRYGLLLIIFFAVATQVMNFLPAHAVDASESITDTLLRDTNSEREIRQLKPLVLNDKLSKAATLKADDMLTQQYWAHVAPDGSTPWRWVKETGYSYSYAGENLAKNFRTSEAIMAAWMASPEHQANVLSRNYSEVGFAFVNGEIDGKSVKLTVALYGAPLMATTVATTTSREEVSTLVGEKMGIMERMNVAASSMGLMPVASILMLLIGVVVALLAHAHRKKMPKKLHVSWYRHHGAIKAGGMLSLCFIIVFLYSGGQI
jgi:hypothetical protein